MGGVGVGEEAVVGECVAEGVREVDDCGGGGWGGGGWRCDVDGDAMEFCGGAGGGSGFGCAAETIGAGHWEIVWSVLRMVWDVGGKGVSSLNI